MNHFYRHAFISIFFSLLSVAAYAENNKNIAVSYIQINYKDGNLPELNPTMIGIYGTYEVVSGFSAEVRLAYSYDTDRLSYTDSASQELEKDIDVSSVFGGYVKYEPLKQGRFVPYFLAGMTYLEVEDTTVEIDGAEVLDNRAGGGSSFSYGVGLNVQLAEQLLIGIDYMNYYDKSPFEITALGIHLGYQF